MAELSWILIGIGAIGVCIACAAVGIRRRRFEALRTQAEALVPPLDSVVWKQRSPDLPGRELVEGSMITAAELLNPDVLDDLERRINLGDSPSATQLYDYLKVHHDAIFTATGPRFIGALQDFVGEQVAHHDLIAQGDHAYMSTVGSVPGWDLQVDGHLFQSKLAGSPLALASGDFEANPHVDVICDHSLTSHFHDSIGVELTMPAVGALTGGSNGASTGGRIGGMFDKLTPARTTFGKWIGSISTALEDFKTKRFRQALERYTALRNTAETRVNRATIEGRSAIARFVKERDEHLASALTQEQRLFLAAAREAAESVRNDRGKACKIFAAHLASVNMSIWDGYGEFERKHRSSWFRRTFYPTEGDVAIVLARRWAELASQPVARLRNRIDALLRSNDESKWTSAASLISNFMQNFECDAESYYREIKVDADRALAVQTAIDENIADYETRLRTLVTRAQREVNAFVDAAHFTLSKELQEIMAPVNAALEDVRAEGRKLGKAIG